MGHVGHWHTWNKLGLLFQPSVTRQLEGRVLLAGRLQSKAEDSGVFDGNCVLQFPPVNRYPWAPLLPWLCFHLITLCCHWSISVNRTQSRASASCDHAPRLNPPQIRSQKKLWCFTELRICPYSINVTLAPSRVLFRQDTEQHLIKANVSGLCTEPQTSQKWSFRKNPLDATKCSINVEIS